MKQVLFLFFTFFTLFTQAQSEKNGNPNEFDFWLGEWDLYWNDSLKGTNTITKEHNGLVIHESFTDNKTGYKGESWSMYVAKDKKWKQTWVDNGGSYLALEGMYTKTGMVLFSNQVKEGKKIRFRMRFLNIRENSFDWEWSSSTDVEKTWKVLWAIQYKRRNVNAPVDQTYLNQQFANGKNYFLALIKKGPEYDKMDSSTTKKVLGEHLTYLFTLHKQGKLNVFGPVMEDKGELSGISIYNVTNKEEAKELAENDPAVKAGRIIVEIIPWFSIKGYKLE